MFKKLISIKFLSVVFIAGLALMAFSVQLQQRNSITSLQKDFKADRQVPATPPKATPPKAIVPPPMTEREKDLEFEGNLIPKSELPPYDDGVIKGEDNGIMFREKDYRPAPRAKKAVPKIVPKPKAAPPAVPKAVPKVEAKPEPKGVTIPDLPNGCFLLGKWFSFIGGISLVGKLGFGFFSFIRRKLKRKKDAQDAPIEMPVND